MSDFTYNYTREALVGGGFNIQNPARVDDQGDQIYLAKEIETAFPGKKFYLRCNGTPVKITFKDVELTEAEKTTLDGLIQTHKDNT